MADIKTEVSTEVKAEITVDIKTDTKTETKREAETIECPPAKKSKIIPFPEYTKLLEYATDGKSCPCFRSDQVGINLYNFKESFGKSVDSIKPLKGTLKHMFTDFVVREVDQAGVVASMDKFEYTDSEIDTLNGIVPEPVRNQEEDKIELEKIFGNSLIEKIGKLDKTDRDTIIELPQEITSALDKEGRKNVHIWIRSAFSGNVMSSVDAGSFKIKFKSHQKVLDSRDRNDRRGKKDHKLVLRFVLAKQNVDTINAVNEICKRIRAPMNKRVINYAGTKDKRACTTQFCTTTCDARKLIGLNSAKNSRIKVGNFEQVKNQVGLGDISANQFCLVIRDVDEGELTPEVIENFKNDGFINYFGLQRFGLSSPNPLTGLAIIKQDFETAVRIALYPFDCKLGSHEVEKARETFTNNPENLDSKKKVIKSAIEKMGWKRGLEKDLLQALERYGETNYYQAINSLNRNLKTIFGHSYQSWLFNMLVNKRLEMKRNGLLAGDLVMGEGNQIIEITDANIEECESKGLFKSLILPIVGYDVKIPSNVEQFVNDTLKEHGIDVQSFDHKNREFKLGGTYCGGLKKLIKSKNIRKISDIFRPKIPRILRS